MIFLGLFAHASIYFLKTVLESEVTVKEVKAQCVQTSGNPLNRAARLDVTIDGTVSLAANTSDVPIRKDKGLLKHIAKGDREMEAKHMMTSANDWFLFVEGREAGRKEGLQRGIAVLILDNLESGASRESIINKMQKWFQIDAQQAEFYYSLTCQALS